MLHGLPSQVAGHLFRNRAKERIPEPDESKVALPNNPAAASYQAQADPLAETNGAQARPRY